MIFLEPKRRYWGREAVDTSRPRPGIGQAMVRRAGADVTVLTYGGLVATALSAAEIAARQHGWSLEVIDLRSLVPLDFDTVAASIRRTGRCVVLHEGPRSLGYGAGLAARIQEEMFYGARGTPCCAPAGSTPHIHRRDWRSCGCPAPTGCWTASSDLSGNRLNDDRVKVFVVPDLGEGLEEVTLTCWQVAVGDEVELNQPLCTVETAKAEVEIPQPVRGTHRRDTRSRR